MKITNDMLFAHPVLSPVSDDFQDAVFESEFAINLEDENVLLIDATVQLNCAELDQLLEHGGAGCGFYVVCRPTYQNRLIEMTPGTARHTLNANQFFGTVQLRPVIWSKEPKTGWRSRHLHPEYGGVADFPFAALLAVGSEYRFSVDRERLKPFESIFALAAGDELVKGEIAVDPESDKILIVVHPEIKDSIDNIRNDPRGRTVLLNAVYLPAVMQVLSDMGQGDRAFEGRAWYRIFTAKCAAAGVDPTNGNMLQNAQQLLDYPFGRIEEQKERLFE